jgi:hypothetical protein
MLCPHHDVPNPTNFAAMDETLAGPVNLQGFIKVTAANERKHEATEGTTSVSAWPAVDDARGTKKDRDECHLHGMPHPLHPCVALMHLVLGDKKPLPDA